MSTLSGKADPGDYDGPRFDAAMPVDALFERRHFHDFGQVENLVLRHRTLDRDAPRRSLQVAGILGRLVFTGAELIVIVVAGDVLERRGLFIGAERAFDGSEFGGGRAAGGEQGSARYGNGGQKGAAVQVGGLRRYF